MTAMHLALRKRYAAPAWAYFEEVRNGTGYARRVTRTADAVALGLWPSLGMDLHGFEVKASRSDWKRELEDPEKSAEIQRFCDRWWLVTAEKVVEDIGEVPPSWGWIELVGGKKLVTRREAPKLESQPLDRLMLAALLRKANEVDNARIARSVTAQVTEQLQDERANFAAKVTSLTERLAASEGRALLATNLLAEISSGLGVKLFGDDGAALPRERWPTELLEKLAAFSQADLSDLRHHLRVAASELRRAGVLARSTLRSVGVRHQLQPWERRAR